MNANDAKDRFYEFVWPHRTAILRTAQYLIRSTHEAEDLAQETLMKAFKAIDRFQPGTDAKKWLMTILRNTRIDHLRAAGPCEKTISLDQMQQDPPGLKLSEQTDVGDVRENPEEVLNRFTDEDVIDALQHLPEEIRWTLLLVDVEEIDLKEAATILDVPVGTIKSRAHRGREMLRQTLLPLMSRSAL